MQHSIILNTFNNFDTSVTEFNKQIPNQKTENQTQKSADWYGKMSFYGEYGDDGTVFLSGRNGGDTYDKTISMWTDWQHVQDYAKFDGFQRVDSHYDLISLGISYKQSNMKQNTFHNVGGFGGFATARENTHSSKITENGGYAGLYYAYYTHGLMFQTAADFGVLYNDAESSYGGYDFTNMWAGGGLGTNYNIFLDNTSVLQPGLYAGYTWIHTDDYEPQPGVTTDDFHMFELSPSLRIITPLGNGWVNSMSARYVFNFSAGGVIHNAGVALPELDLRDYCEYGFTIEKNIERFNFATSINRRDGGRTGWLFNIHMKYMF